MAKFHITAVQLKDMISQLVDQYVSSDGDNEPPTGGTIEVEFTLGTNECKLSSYHNLIEYFVDFVEQHGTKVGG